MSILDKIAQTNTGTTKSILDKIAGIPNNVLSMPNEQLKKLFQIRKYYETLIALAIAIPTRQHALAVIARCVKVADVKVIQSQQDFACLTGNVRKGTNIRLYYLKDEEDKSMIYDIIPEGGTPFSQEMFVANEANIFPAMFWAYPPFPYIAVTPNDADKEMRKKLNSMKEFHEWIQILQYTVHKMWTQNNFSEERDTAFQKMTRTCTLLQMRPNLEARERIESFSQPDHFNELGHGAFHAVYEFPYTNIIVNSHPSVKIPTVLRIPLFYSSEEKPIPWHNDLLTYGISRYIHKMYGRPWPHFPALIYPTPPIIALVYMPGFGLIRLLCTVMERVDLSLLQYLNKKNNNIPLEFLKRLTKDVKWLDGIFHSDLSLNNILVRQLNSVPMPVFIDFDFATSPKPSLIKTLEQDVGKIPEEILEDDVDFTRCDPSPRVYFPYYDTDPLAKAYIDTHNSYQIQTSWLLDANTTKVRGTTDGGSNNVGTSATGSFPSVGPDSVGSNFVGTPYEFSTPEYSITMRRPNYPMLFSHWGCHGYKNSAYNYAYRQLQDLFEQHTPIERLHDKNKSFVQPKYNCKHTDDKDFVLAATDAHIVFAYFQWYVGTSRTSTQWRPWLTIHGKARCRTPVIAMELTADAEKNQDRIRSVAQYMVSSKDKTALMQLVSQAIFSLADLGFRLEPKKEINLAGAIGIDETNHKFYFIDPAIQMRMSRRSHSKLFKLFPEFVTQGQIQPTDGLF